jgi:hypothetical protein
MQRLLLLTDNKNIYEISMQCLIFLMSDFQFLEVKNGNHVVRRLQYCLHPGIFSIF